MRIDLILRGLAASFLIGLAASANAQYAIQPSGPVAGSCVIDTVQNRTTFTVDVAANVNLPPGANNAMLIGGSKPANLVPLTVSPPNGSLPGSIVWYVNDVPGPGSPVRLGLSIYPASGGAVTGTGMGTEVSCATGAVFSATTPVTLATAPDAPYVIWYTGEIVGASCSTTGLAGQLHGGFNLPPPTSANIVGYITMGQSATLTQTYTSNPAVGEGTSAFEYTIPATPLPYTISAEFYPYYNGVRVGTGVRLAYTCTANGLILTPPQPVATAAPSIPALGPWALIALAGLLVAGARIARRGGAG